MGTVSRSVNPFILGVSPRDLLRTPGTWPLLKKNTLVLAFEKLRFKDISQLMSKGAQVMSFLAMASDKIYLSVEAICKYIAKNSGEGGTFSAKADQISPWYSR